MDPNSNEHGLETTTMVDFFPTPPPPSPLFLPHPPNPEKHKGQKALLNRYLNCI